MKKTLALVLAILLLLAPAALATSDLSGMTMEQLIHLRTQIEAELLARGGSASIGVPPGKYVVGQDIPSGTYKITITNSSAVGGMIVVYQNESTMNSEGSYLFMELLSGLTGNPTIGKITLSDGNGVWVSNGMLTFEKYVGIGL